METKNMFKIKLSSEDLIESLINLEGDVYLIDLPIGDVVFIIKEQDKGNVKKCAIKCFGESGEINDEKICTLLRDILFSLVGIGLGRIIPYRYYRCYYRRKNMNTSNCNCNL